MKTKIVCITCADKHLIPTKSPIKPHWTGSCRCERCGELKRAEFLRYETERFVVYLTYFKPNGKFYATSKFELDAGRPIHEIFDLVQEKAVAQKLPGLNEGHDEYIVLIDIPAHPHNYPQLVNTEAVLMQAKKRLASLQPSKGTFRQGW